MNQYKLLLLLSLILPSSLTFATEPEISTPGWAWMGTEVRYKDLVLDSNLTLECFDIQILSSGISVGTEAGAAIQAENAQQRLSLSAQYEVSELILNSSLKAYCSKNASLVTSEKVKKIAELEGMSADIYYEITHRIGWYKDSFGIEEKEDFGIYQKCVNGLRKFELVRQIQAYCKN